MKILVINGPNINMLGIREPSVYGKRTYADLVKCVKDHAQKIGVEVDIFQSNHEGEIIDRIQETLNTFDALIINPAAYTHTSIAIADALKAVNLPCVEVHLTDTSKREEYRKLSYVSECVLKTIKGNGIDGYTEALDYLYNCLSK